MILHTSSSSGLTVSFSICCAPSKEQEFDYENNQYQIQYQLDGLFTLGYRGVGANPSSDGKTYRQAGTEKPEDLNL